VVLAEFGLVAFVVGIATQTGVACLATFVGLLAAYRLPVLAVPLSLVLCAYWGLVGYSLGASTGKAGMGPVAAALGILASAHVHRAGLAALRAAFVRLGSAVS
jgi:hypothetical protein